MTRRFRPAPVVAVETGPDGAPVRLRWRGGWERARVTNRWRLEDDWWRQGGEVVRAYYQLVTAAGTVCVVYYDELAGVWRLESVVD